MSWYTVRESNFAIYVFASFWMESAFKRMNLLLKEQILSFKSRPLLEQLSPPGKQIGNLESRAHL